MSSSSGLAGPNPNLRRRSVPSGCGLRRCHVSPTLRAGEEQRARIVLSAPFGHDGMTVLAQAQAATELVENNVLARPAGPSRSSRRGGSSSKSNRSSGRSSSRRSRRRSSSAAAVLAAADSAPAAAILAPTAR